MTTRREITNERDREVNGKSVFHAAEMSSIACSQVSE